MNTPDITEIQAYEGFIRRAAAVNAPFMLKGSFVTRQFFPSIHNRTPRDLDWVYLEEVDDDEMALDIFKTWILTLCELDLEDGNQYTCLTHANWNLVDYAMEEDFPTASLVLAYRNIENNTLLNIDIEISYNLKMHLSPVPLTLKMSTGVDLTFPLTPPLELQIAWKIHHCITEPRFKDFIDLIYLVSTPSFSPTIVKKTIDVVLKECRFNDVSLIKIEQFFLHDFEVLFYNAEIFFDYWMQWRLSDSMDPDDLSDAETIFPDCIIPKNIFDLFDEVSAQLNKAGFNMESLIKSSNWDEKKLWKLREKNYQVERNQNRSHLEQRIFDYQNPELNSNQNTSSSESFKPSPVQSFKPPKSGADPQLVTSIIWIILLILFLTFFMGM